MKIKQKTLIKSFVCFLFCISLGFYSGFSFNLLAFLIIYLIINIKDLKNKKFVLENLFYADLLISLFILDFEYSLKRLSPIPKLLIFKLKLELAVAFKEKNNAKVINIIVLIQPPFLLLKL